MSVQNNRFLTFQLSQETYGLPITKVKEIIGVMDINVVPGMPDYVRGVINLRGKIIPALDLRLRFGFPEEEMDDRTCIIVVENPEGQSGELTGIIVDRVSEVLDINEESIEEPPAYGNDGEDEFINGMGKMEDRVIMLLNSDRITGNVEAGSTGEEAKDGKNGGHDVEV